MIYAEKSAFTPPHTDVQSYNICFAIPVFMAALLNSFWTFFCNFKDRFPSDHKNHYITFTLLTAERVCMGVVCGWEDMCWKKLQRKWHKWERVTVNICSYVNIHCIVFMIWYHNRQWHFNYFHWICLNNSAGIIV